MRTTDSHFMCAIELAASDQYRPFVGGASNPENLLAAPGARIPTLARLDRIDEFHEAADVVDRPRPLSRAEVRRDAARVRHRARRASGKVRDVQRTPEFRP